MESTEGERFCRLTTGLGTTTVPDTISSGAVNHGAICYYTWEAVLREPSLRPLAYRRYSSLTFLSEPYRRTAVVNSPKISCKSGRTALLDDSETHRYGITR